MQKTHMILNSGKIYYYIFQTSVNFWWDILHAMLKLTKVLKLFRGALNTQFDISEK